MRDTPADHTIKQAMELELELESGGFTNESPLQHKKRQWAGQKIRSVATKVAITFASLVRIQIFLVILKGGHFGRLRSTFCLESTHQPILGGGVIPDLGCGTGTHAMGRHPHTTHLVPALTVCMVSFLEYCLVFPLRISHEMA